LPELVWTVINGEMSAADYSIRQLLPENRILTEHRAMKSSLRFARRRAPQ